MFCTEAGIHDVFCHMRAIPVWHAGQLRRFVRAVVSLENGDLRAPLRESGYRESNPGIQLGKLTFYH